ncbi:MAG: hypothetical protein ACFCGT_18760 [Sandaracinaceae bacterium]
MLDDRWIRVRLGLQVYGAAVLFQLVLVVTLGVVVALLGPDHAHDLLLVVTHVLRPLAAIAGLVGLMMFARVPEEAAARRSSAAAVRWSGVALLLVPVVLLLPRPLFAVAEGLRTGLNVLAAVALLAALREVGRFLRADDLYFRAEELRIGVYFLAGLAVLTAGLMAAVGLVGTLLVLAYPLALSVVSVFYVLIVLRGAQAIGERL